MKPYVANLGILVLYNDRLCSFTGPQTYLTLLSGMVSTEFGRLSIRVAKVKEYFIKQITAWLVQDIEHCRACQVCMQD